MPAELPLNSYWGRLLEAMSGALKRPYAITADTSCTEPIDFDETESKRKGVKKLKKKAKKKGKKGC